MTVYSVQEAQIRARNRRARGRLFVVGRFRSTLAFARAVRIDNGQEYRIFTGERTPGLGFPTYMPSMRLHLGIVRLGRFLVGDHR